MKKLTAAKAALNKPVSIGNIPFKELFSQIRKKRLQTPGKTYGTNANITNSMLFNKNNVNGMEEKGQEDVRRWCLLVLALVIPT